MRLAIGLMSGTSGDGISGALCSFTNRRFEIIGYRTSAYPPAIAQALQRGPSLPAAEVSRLNMVLGRLFAACALKLLQQARLPASAVAAIGSHGHTLYHGPADKPRNTLQIGEPSVIAERTGIPVVADFRMRDLAAGGEGAPLMPFFDQYFFGGNVRALQNIGGIANVTVTGPSGVLAAFDNGPGNCLIDWATRRVTGNRLPYDRDGAIAARGFIDMKAIRNMASHPYFQKRPPKSTGRELFNPAFLPRELAQDRSENLVATLTYFTAHTLRESFARFVPVRPEEIIVSGGGARNGTLMHHLRLLFYPTPVQSIEDRGIPAQAKEPIAFAFFALQAIENKINHCPEATGASSPRILGKILPAHSPGMAASRKVPGERISKQRPVPFLTASGRASD
jgi:anhydro-N-acetylmuramic acid kinase